MLHIVVTVALIFLNLDSPLLFFSCWAMPHILGLIVSSNTPGKIPSTWYCVHPMESGCNCVWLFQYHCGKFDHLVNVGDGYTSLSRSIFPFTISGSCWGWFWGPSEYHVRNNLWVRVLGIYWCLCLNKNYYTGSCKMVMLLILLLFPHVLAKFSCEEELSVFLLTNRFPFISNTRIRS